MPRRPAQIDSELLSDYADIAQGLVARLRDIAFYDSQMKLLWSRGAAPPPLLQAAVTRLVKERSMRAVDALAVRLSDSSMAYALAASCDKRLVGACAVVIAAQGEQSAAPKANQLRKTLAPVLKLLGRALRERARGGRKSDTSSERTRELEWLIDVSSDRDGGGSGDNNAILAQMLRGATRRMSCTIGAVLMPERQVNLIMHRDNAVTSDAHTLLERLRPSLLETSYRRQRSIVVNQLTDRKGEQSPFKVIAVPIVTDAGKSSGVLVLLRPATMRDFARRHLYLCKHLSRQVAALLARRFDLATGLHTRSALETHVRELSSANPAACTASVLHIDIDLLHLVNERFGFDRGDQLIARFAGQLQAPLLPASAVAARIAGDQFAVYLPSSSLEQAEQCANSLHAAIRSAAQAVVPERPDVSLSIGVAEISGGVEGFSRALAFAELACKAAKDHGRNRVECFRDADATMARRYKDIGGLRELRDALESGRLTLFAQKIVPLQKTGTESYEILLRALDPNGEPVSPARYLSAAQRYQMLGRIDDWVLEHALEQCGRFRNELFERRAGISINVSGASLTEAAFWERTEQQLTRAKLAPGLLTFEITENVALSNLTQATSLISRLKSRGCRFALDDFGIGVNSLSYLKSLPVNRVKIDGSFVHDILENPRSEATVRAIVNLTHEMRIETVAEFVENERIQQFVRQLGIDYAQGYAVGRPEPLEEVLSNLARDVAKEREKMLLEF